MSSFEELEAELTASSGGPAISDETLGRLWLTIDDQIDTLRAQQKEVERQLAMGVNIAIGEHVRDAGKLRITVAWPEKYVWDEAQLYGLVGNRTGPLPAFVTDTIQINKRVFDRASPEEQAPWLKALTRQPGVRKVTVKVL